LNLKGKNLIPVEPIIPAKISVFQRAICRRRVNVEFGILTDRQGTSLPPEIAMIYIIRFLLVLGLYADRLIEKIRYLIKIIVLPAGFGAYEQFKIQ
jgi:hypothetical protein